MSNNYFINPELSKKLEQLGVVSALDYWWRPMKTRIAIDGMLQSDVILLSGFRDTDEWEQRAYHWSDVCLPVNAKKIWGDEYLEIKNVISRQYVWESFAFGLVHRVQWSIYKKRSWQTWLEGEVDKALAN